MVGQKSKKVKRKFYKRKWQKTAYFCGKIENAGVDNLEIIVI